MLKAKHFAPGSVVRCAAAVTALAILPFGVALAQDGVKNSKKIVKQKESDLPKFDVLVSRTDDKKSGHGKPVAIAITFADGSTQKVDISKYGFVTIDIAGRRVKMYPAGKQPKFIAGPMSAHIADVASYKAPVRIPLPKGFAPDKGPIVDKLESRKKTAKKKVDNRDKTKLKDDDRLDRLETMIHDLQKQMKSLRAEIKRHD